MDAILFLLLEGASIAFFAFVFSRLSKSAGLVVFLLATGLVGMILCQPHAYVVGNMPGLGEAARGGPIAINYGTPEQHLVLNLPFTVGDVQDLRKFGAGSLAFVVLCGLLLGLKLKQSRATSAKS